MTIQTKYGLMYTLPGDSLISESLRWYGEWAGREIEFLRHTISQGNVVVDVGAFIGTHTLAFSRLVGDRGAVHAFEVQPSAVAVLNENVAVNNLQNVTVLSLIHI